MTASYQDLGLIAVGSSAELRRVLVEHQLYAQKRLHPYLQNYPEAVLLFEDEALLGEKLSHPNIAACLSHGIDAQGPYQQQRFVPGPTLEKLLSVVRMLPWPIAATLWYDLARALQGLAQAYDTKGPLYVIHRDLNPSNLIVSLTGEAILVDFGVALWRDSRTARETVRGTSAYMSPEQVRGEPLTCQSDLYSLASVMFEALTGTRAFVGEEAHILLSVASGKHATFPESLPTVAHGLLSAMFSLDPAQRPNAAQICESLSRFCVSPQDVQAWLRSLVSRSSQ